ncbi:MAG: MFS transporter, partial [bacterium]
MVSGNRLNIFILASSHSINSLYNRLLTPLIPLIVIEFGLSYAQAGLILSTYAVANSLFQFPISFAADYTGRRRTILALSILINALPVIFYGLASTYTLLLLLVFVSGLG